MSDYASLDLSMQCNAGIEFIGPGVQPALGALTLRGLPFMVGSPDVDPARCFLGFAGDTPPMTIPIHATAHNVIFAQTLLESQVYAGEPIGHIVAQYVFQYADGETVRIPIRERFEISTVPPGWGQLPFLAVPDRYDSLQPRYAGRWDNVGRRLTEVNQAMPQSYYLWAWENPQPERELASVTIEPTDRKFLVAAITLGHLAETPFARTGKREVKIELPNADAAAQPFKLEVDTDRGIATYPFALPQATADQFIGDDYQGWGESLNQQASPAYVEIAATPSATVTVKQAGETLAEANWGELQTQGRIETPRVNLEVVDRGRNWVKVTVVDDATGQPVPCRVHFRSPEGIPYQPHGHHTQVASNLDSWHWDVGGDLRLGQITYAYIDGTCQGWLPRGDVIVDVARGFEYEPLRAKVRVEPGQQALTLRLKRWTDMNAQRWFSGDSHVHFLGTAGAHWEAQAEDLNIVNLLQSQWGHLFTNAEDALGQTVTNGGRTVVYTSQENRQHMLGHLILWGLKSAVMPWCSDGPGEAELGGTLEEAMSYWADACHEQGGTVVLPHLPNPNGEPAILIATGRVEAIEMIRQDSYAHTEYYRYLNGGYRLPLVGGTDKMSSEVPVGLYRTYAYVPDSEEFNYHNWCHAVTAGRTFLSGGPILHFTVNGAQVGDTLTLPPGGGTVEIEATAELSIPIHTLEIVQQGRVVADTQDAKGSRRLHLKTSLKVDGNTWLAARCGGPNYWNRKHHDVWARGVFAHTSPIYVAVGGEWGLYNDEAMQYMLTLIEGNLAYMHHTALHHHDPHSVTHHHGEADHMAYLERPFHAAKDAILKRIAARR